MFALRPKQGFTLIEVLAAVGAFTIAFLVGFAAIGTFMIKQDQAFQRTVAATFAMTLADWTSKKNQAAATSHIEDHPALKVASSTAFSKVKFRGGISGNEVKTASDTLLYFDTVATVSDGYSTLTIDPYAPLLITASSSAASVKEDDSKIVWRQISIWYGSREDVIASANTTAEFLGRYLIPEAVIP